MHRITPAIRSKSGLWCFAVCLLLTLLGSTGLAQPITLLSDKLATPSNGDGAPGDGFGNAVAVSGNTALIGAYGDTVVAAGATFGITQGSAYVFVRDGDQWIRVQKLTPEPVGLDGDNFGVSVALQTEVAAVGAPRRSPNQIFEAGSVFIYGRTQQGLLLRQTLSAAGAEQRFGTSVALWQDQLAVGVPRAGAGRVDIYQRDAGGLYQFQRSLTDSGLADGARFGTALAVADAELLIGAPFADNTGVVYRSRFSGGAWSNATRLALTAQRAAELGTAIAIDSGVALVGAPGLRGGEVRVLQLAQMDWQQVGLLTQSSAATGNRFGNALAIDPQRAVVGAVATQFSEGAAAVFSRSGAQFSPFADLDIADGSPANRFGASVALAADGVLIGADLDAVGPHRSQGSVRWYKAGPTNMIVSGQLDNGNGAMFDRYGTALAVNGDIAVVGAFVEDTESGADAGRVHWFERSNGLWTYGGALDAPDASIEDRFGIAVDVDGDYIAIGAYWDVVGNNVDQGSVYVFRRQGMGWVFDAKLTASDGRERDLFGFALALQGTRLLVGARGAAMPFLDQGRAYVYVRGPNAWVEEAQLDLPQPASLVYFGASVAWAGDKAIVGAPGDSLNSQALSVGAAYVFQPQGSVWTMVAKLRAPIPQENAAFGFSVAADQTRLLVGAFQDGTVGQGVGYVYQASDLKLDGELRSPSAQGGEGLGISVAISGTRALLGAAGYDLSGQLNVGTGRLFERSAGGWRESQQFFAADPQAGDNFGRAVAIDATTVLLGAPNKGIDNPLEGAAYVGRVDSLLVDGFE